jgi:hypothetical protein
VKAFAIIRHEKIKAGRHLVSCGLHNIRGVPTPNADSDAPEPVRIIVGSKKPWRDVSDALKAMKIDKIRKGGVVAFEQLSSASPEWWKAKGWVAGRTPSAETQAVIDDWVSAELALARSKYGHLLVSMVLHLDEAHPHLHGLIIPAQYRVDARERGDKKGRLAWRMSAEQMIRGPSHLRELVTEHADAMAKFGLVRGETRDLGTVKHKPVKKWHQEQAAQAEKVGTIIMEQLRIRDESSNAAEAVIAAARMKAAAIIAEAEKKAKDQADLEVAAEAIRRRKADDARALELRVHAARDQVLTARKALDVDRAAIKAEREEVAVVRGKLDALLRKAETMLRPILDMADQWRRATPIVRAAMGLKGPMSVKIADSADVRMVLEMSKRKESSR